MATKRSKAKGTDLAVAARWVFLAGVAISAIVGLVLAVPSMAAAEWQNWVIYVIIALGLIGGYLHVSKADEHNFILLALGLAVFSDRLGYIPSVGNYLVSIFSVITVYLAMVVIAIVVRNMVDWFRS